MGATAQLSFYRIERRRDKRLLASKARLAADSQARRKGLLGRDRLEPGEGLILYPCEAIHTFRMKFPIDVVFFDKNRRVVKVVAEIPANRVAFSLRAEGVVELPAGTVKATGLQEGDILEFIRVEAPNG